MTQQQNRAAIYCRLSVDDGDGESMSIQNQRDMLTRYAKENGFLVHKVYIDDGYSGTNFERPQFKQMIEDIESRLIDIVITKDLSRLGRDYLKTGTYIEIYFPANDVRYIAVNDGVDSANGCDEFLGIRNIMNEFYAKDISKKIRAARKSLAKQGKFTSPFAPYGYKKDPNDKHRLLVDENTAPIVKKMFELAAEGKTPTDIAKKLKEDKVLIPRAYTASVYGIYLTGYDTKDPYHWLSATVAEILRSKQYLGTLVNHRWTSKSFKNKKVIQVPQEEWIEVENTHEAIIDRETWDIVQKLVKVKKRPNKQGVSQIFAGLVKCADCGHSLSFSQSNAGGKTGHFVCNYARNKGKEYCSWHYISYKTLYTAVLTHITTHTILLKKDRAAFETMLQKHLNTQNKQQLAALKKEQYKLQQRLDELGKILKKLYEDTALSRISDEEYTRLSADFITERQEAEARLKGIATELAKHESDLSNVTKFIAVIEKHIDLKELNKAVLNELIEKIIVHEFRKEDGVRKQRVDIHYRFIGNLNDYVA